MSDPAKPPPIGRALATLSLGALGVVYGDIGTSPLYALKECFWGPQGFPVDEPNVLGILSLIFWSLNFVVTFKYLTMVMRADNRGEGGILALLALARPRGTPRGLGRVLVAAGLFGSALLYGDGIITPAISVLSAVEGLSIATPALQHLVVPIAFVIILGLFFFQRRGTAGVGAVFGPVTLAWFLSLAALGISGIARQPSVLRALNPWHAVDFFLREGVAGFTVLAAIILVVTGGEALYADMGHFGRRPIRVAWFVVVLPALVLNYFGQGALLLADPSAARNPFYSLVPAWGLYPMVGLATAAAVVASQALISGAFSLTRQAVQLGYCPRVNIVHTSKTEIGQIYVPAVNNLLMVACLGLVVTFGSADRLAGTYGVALSGTMTMTSILFAVVARNRWHWSYWKVAGVTALFLAVDLAFVGSNLAQDPARRVVPAGGRRTGVHPDVDLEEGPGPARRAGAREHLADGPVPPGHPATAAAPGARGGGLPHVGYDGGTAGAAPSPEAQPGAAREGDADVDPHRGDSPGRRGRPGPVPGAGRGLLPGGGPLRLHGDAGRARHPPGARPDR